MSSPQVQEWRKGETIALAVEAIKGPKPESQDLDGALEEPLLSDENKLAAIVAELVESVGHNLVWELETGRTRERNAVTLYKIAQALGVEVDELVEQAEQEKQAL